MFVADFLSGILIIAVGVVGVKYNAQITRTFGNNEWINHYLGPSATYGLFMILAFGVIVYGFLTMFGLSDDVIQTVLAPLRGVFSS